MKWDELHLEQCAIARFLSVLGDRWTLMILSDSFLGARRFETFEARLGISRTILTQRLQALCEHGILERVPYRERPTRHEYRLTGKGLDLHPVMLTMSAWSNTHYPDRGGPPLLFEHTRCGHDFTPVTSCSACGEPVPALEVRARARAPRPRVPAVRRGPIQEEIPT